jgi:hypothetical protein
VVHIAVSVEECFRELLQIEAELAILTLGSVPFLHKTHDSKVRDILI